jgi:hypothetical protein
MLRTALGTDANVRVRAGVHGEDPGPFISL